MEKTKRNTTKAHTQESKQM